MGLIKWYVGKNYRVGEKDETNDCKGSIIKLQASGYVYEQVQA